MVGELDAFAAATGRAWAARTVEALRAQDRPLLGAWPGTLREARGQLAVALSSRRDPPLTAERMDVLARATYASARVTWATHAEPDLEP